MILAYQPACARCRLPTPLHVSCPARVICHFRACPHHLLVSYPPPVPCHPCFPCPFRAILISRAFSVSPAVPVSFPWHLPPHVLYVLFDLSVPFPCILAISCPLRVSCRSRTISVSSGSPVPVSRPLPVPSSPTSALIAESKEERLIGAIITSTTTLSRLRSTTVTQPLTCLLGERSDREACPGDPHGPPLCRPAA